MASALAQCAPIIWLALFTDLVLDPLQYDLAPLLVDQRHHRPLHHQVRPPLHLQHGSGFDVFRQTCKRPTVRRTTTIRGEPHDSQRGRSSEIYQFHGIWIW